MRLFEKPKDLKYTDMAIWIDSNAYEPNCDDSKLYEYTYHIVRMLAYQSNYFKTTEMYEEFSAYAASRTYFRLKNKKQFEYNLDGTPKMNKVKSILNFLKTTVYPMKVDFEQQEYSQNNQSDNPHIPLEDIEQNYPRLTDYFQSNELNSITFECYLTQLGNTIRSFLRNIPEASKPAEWKNIYLSCLLTLLDNITISNKDKVALYNLRETMYDDKIDKLYQKESLNEPILFHLDKSKANYIKILCNRVKKTIAKELSTIVDMYETPESVCKYAILDELYNKSNLEEDY